MYSDYYPYGLVINEGANNYRYGYQGQYAEKDPETDWNAFELRMYDSKIARWLTTDPEGEFWSPYIAMGNNPSSTTDPTGGFSSWWAATWHSLFNGGGSVKQNRWGEYYVSRVSNNGDEYGATVTNIFGKGRHPRRAALEEFAKDQWIMADIQMKGDKSMFKMYDSPEEAGWAAVGIGTGLGLSATAPALKGGSVGVDASEPVNSSAHLATEGANLSKHLDQLEKYGKAGFKELQNGSFRYYGNIKSATTAGEMQGARLVREWNPATGKTRTWYETLDHAGKIRQVHPKYHNLPHYKFDAGGKYIGKWK